MTNGRPRKWDRELIMKKLIEWAKKPDSLNLNAFCCQEEIMLSPTKLLQFVDDDDSFREVYDLVKSFIGVRREEYNGRKQLSDTAYGKHAHVYDKFYVRAGREEKQFEAGIARDFEKYKKQLSDSNLTEDMDKLNEKFDQLLSHFSGAEPSLSKENIDCSQINSDKKS